MTTNNLKYFNNKIKIIENLISNINKNNLSSKLKKLYSELDHISISKKGVNKEYNLKSKLETLKSKIKDTNEKINSIIKLINQEPNEESKNNENNLLSLISVIINEIIYLDMDNYNVTNQIKKLKLFKKILVFYTYLNNLNNKVKQNLIREFFDKYLYIFFGNLDELIKSTNLRNKTISQENLQTIINLKNNIKSFMPILKNNKGISINSKLIKLKKNILNKTKNKKLESFKLNFNTFKTKLN